MISKSVRTTFFILPSFLENPLIYRHSRRDPCNFSHEELSSNPTSRQAFLEQTLHICDGNQHEESIIKEIRYEAHSPNS